MSAATRTRSRSCPAWCQPSARPRPKPGHWSPELEELIIPGYGLAQLAKVLEIPAERLELDRGLPEEVYARPLVEGAQSRFELVTELARRDNLTVRQLIGRLGGGRGHRTFAGTPEQVADTIVEWAEAGAADGFNVMPPVLPSGLEAFTDAS